MACDVSYLGQDFTTAEFKLFVEANPEQFSKYLNNTEEAYSSIDYDFRAANILSSERAVQVFKSADKGQWPLEKTLKELQIPTAQRELLLTFGTRNREELLTSLLANYSYTVEINTAKDRAGINSNQYSMTIDGDVYTDTGFGLTKNGEFLSDVEAKEFLDKYGERTNSSHYSNLTVPGGTNYTENEIKTPDITPSIKGHAAFATKQGIGWFRSDDKIEGWEITEAGKKAAEAFDLEPEGTKTITGKTRRILEVQSDLFQKGRDAKDLVGIGITKVVTANLFENDEFNFELDDSVYEATVEEVYYPDENQSEPTTVYYRNGSKISQKAMDAAIAGFKSKNIQPSKNQFLQLLNKDNNWVTFFVKSIIQDSARKGYENVLFPAGDTAAKVEGHTTISQFIKDRQERIKEVDLELEYLKDADSFTSNDIYASKIDQREESNDPKAIYYMLGGDTVSETVYTNFKNTALARVASKKIQFQQELEQAQEGTLKISAIAKFYEDNIKNILDKRGYNPTRITDEYGNDWYQVELSQKDLDPVEFYSSISDLEEGLKQAATDKAKFDTQIERLIAESNKISNIIGQVDKGNKESPIRSALRDAVRYIRQDKTDLKNFAYFLLEAKEVLKFYSEDLRRIVNLPINQAVVQLDNALVVSRAFKDTINFLKKDFRYTDPQNEFKKLVDELASYYDQIQNIYSSEAEVLAFKFMAEELSGDAKIAYDKLKAELDNLLEQKAKYVAIGSKKGTLGRIDERIEAKKKEIIALVPDAQTIEDVFKGLRGDLNWLTGNFRSTLAMGDPIVSGYARRLKRGYNQVRAVLTPIRNMAQDQFDKYMTATGHSTTESMEKVYEGLYKISNHVVYNDKGEASTEQYYSLLGPIEESFYNDDAKYRNDIKLAKNDGDLAKIEAAQKAYSQWLNKFTERKYVSDWYDRYDLLTPEAYDARQEIWNEIKNKTRGNARDTLTDADYERIGELKQKLKALGSSYENGQLKTGKALAIAQSIQAFNKESARMSTWETTPEGKQWFDTIVAKKRDQVDKGILSKADFDNWYAANTQRVISPEFYAARQVIIDKIQSIMSKLPQQTFQGDIKKLWETIIDVSRPYRDEDNVLVGSNVSTEEGAVVRSSEVAIEELKAKLIRFSGLTIDEEQELQGLWGTLDTLSDDEINRFMDLRDESDAYKDYMGQYISKEQLLTLFQAFAELAAIQKYETTDYYKAVYQSKLREFIERVDPNRLLDVSDATARFEQEDQWYLDNHITKTKKMYQDGKTYFTEVNEPLYIWKDILPTNEDWVEQDAPGFAFKTRIIKPEFINNDYQSMNFEYYKATEPDDFKLIPKRNVDGKISSYISEDYERLKRSNSSVDQARMGMLKFLTDTHLIGQQQLPKFKRLGYDLPGVIKTKYDRVREQGLAGAKTAFGENFRVTQEDRDLTLGDISQIDLSIIPVKYSTRVKPEDQDLNLLGNILKHRAGVEEYAYLEKELPYAKVIQSALRTAPGDVSESMVDRTLKLLGKEKFIKATKESQRSKTFDSFLRTMFYGETEVSPFNSDTWNKRINSAFGLATLQVMTFNFPAHITNILSGEVQNVIESVGGKYMTMRDYFKAKSIYASNVGNFWNDYGKEGNKSFWTEMAERFDVPQGEYLDNFGKKSNFSRLRDLNSHVMFIKQGGEHEIQVSTMIAMALNKKVKLNGSVVSLNDALEMVDGHIRIKAGVTKVDDSAFTEEDMNIFQDQVHSVVRALNGAYAKIDKSVAEKSFLGKLAFYMRKYFLPMAYRRFEPFKYDYEERDFKEGYYQTAWRILGDVVKMNTDLVKNWSIYQDTLTAEEKVNLRRFMAEVGIIGILALTILLIGGYDPDRKFKGRWLYTMAVYELMKVRSETETFIPLPGLGINELTNLFSSPFVPATTAKTAGKLLGDLVSAVVPGGETGRFKRDYGIWKEGELRVKADALKLLGVPVNLLSPELMITNFELRNR